MAKTYDGESAETGPPNNAATLPLAKFIPIIVGLIVVLMAVGLIIQANNTRRTVPGASAGANGTTGPAARPNGTFPSNR